MSSHPIIVTHSGKFHADEIMAIALLQTFYFVHPIAVFPDDDVDAMKKYLKDPLSYGPRAVFQPDGCEDRRTPVLVLRTRNAAILKQATELSYVFVIDVGSAYQPEHLNFDHHQNSMDRRWPNGDPMSSTGIVWDWLKQQGHLSSLPAFAIEDFEEKIIRPFDLHDNGVATHPMCVTIAGYNRDSDDNPLQSAQFYKAFQFCLETIQNLVFSSEVVLEAQQSIEAGWKRAQEKKQTFVRLKEYNSYHQCEKLLFSLSKGQADLIIIPGQGNRYSIKSLPLSLEQSFSIKQPCPEEWRGKTNFTLHINAKPIMIRFAHKTGFQCVVEGTGKDAEDVAQYILNHNLSLQQQPPAQPTDLNNKKTLKLKR